ncbi:hypothetical protein [Qaidamihabitans albus]|uniref:hypothetical protein n=1 Tax=Qaidamihabitans albus TaxID=2795733 RepID=UPI0018F2151B|nr:hypothetical protein [Qaidamihabitans albus]
MAEGKAAAAVSRLGQISREMADRRALRERSAEAAKQQSKESLQAQGKVAEKVAEHLGELGRRQKEAGGWATEKALSDKDLVMGFGPEEDERPADELAAYAPAPGPAGPAAPPPPPAAAAAQPAPAAEPQPEPQQQRKFSRAVAPPPEPEPAAPAPPPPPPRRAPRHARRDSFDDDDFSNNSWMK